MKEIHGSATYAFCDRPLSATGKPEMSSQKPARKQQQLPSLLTFPIRYAMGSSEHMKIFYPWKPEPSCMQFLGYVNKHTSSITEFSSWSTTCLYASRCHDGDLRGLHWSIGNNLGRGGDCCLPEPISNLADTNRRNIRKTNGRKHRNESHRFYS